jgi:DNA (cytosine-5)-methyltransferase 1
VSTVGLFAGIGGLELGFSGAGFQTSLLAEIDPAATTILKARFPGVEIVGDVAGLSGLPDDTTIVTAGFPCQNLSMAGDKQGITGSKSGVVSQLFRLIESSHVPTVVIENVYFLLQLDRGRGMDWLAGQFEELGYSWAYRILDTMGFGLPHRRRRIYLVASKNVDPRCVLFADEAEAQSRPVASVDKPLGFYWTEGRSGIGITVDGIPPLKGGSGLGIPSAPAVLFPDGAVLMPSLSACERLQGFAPGWTAVPGGFERRPEWRLLGNAVSVPVAAWVASRLAQPKEPLQLDTQKLEAGTRWPDAAYNDGNGRVSVKASDKPMAVAGQSIVTFRDESWLELSERALNGFIGRALEGGLHFPPGFLKAVQRAKQRKIAA